MVNCAIIGCSCSSKPGQNNGRRFFKVPSVIINHCEKTKTLSEERRRLWLKRINRKDITSESVKRYTSVCSRHFISGVPSRLFENTSPDWAPSLHLGYESKDAKRAASLGKGRYSRVVEREKRKGKAGEVITDVETQDVKTKLIEEVGKMVICAICNKRLELDKGIKFFPLPALRKRTAAEKELSEKRRNLWLDKMNLSGQQGISNATSVCSNHFVSGHPSNFFDSNSIDWAPSINLSSDKIEDMKPKVDGNQNWNETTKSNYSLNKKTDKVVPGDNYKSIRPINRKRKQTSMTSECLEDVSGTNKNLNTKKQFRDVGCMTDLTLAQLEELEQNLKTIKKISSNLQKKLEIMMDDDMAVTNEFSFSK